MSSPTFTAGPVSASAQIGTHGENRDEDSDNAHKDSESEPEPGQRPVAAAQTQRTRSVQFSTPAWMASPRSGDQGDGERERERDTRAESSGDEITPIMSRERGGGNGRGYDGTTTAAGANTNTRAGTIGRTASQGSNGSGAKRRGKGGGKGKGNGGGGIGGMRGGGEEEEDEGGFWARMAEKFGSVELDNKGSVARDHLALERTFLAWLRTSLAFASIGIAITQLFRLNTTISEREGLTPNNPPNTPHLRQMGKPLGATFLGIAILVLFVGGRRYFESQYWIIRGKFPASRGSIFLITIVAFALIVSSLVIVITIDPSVFEKR